MLGEVIPHAGCRALYRLEDLADSSGNGYTLQTMLSRVHSVGKFGNGIADTSYWLYHSGSIGVDLRNQIYGISFWFKITTHPAEGYGYEFVQWNSSGESYPNTYRSVRVTYANPAGPLVIQLEPCAAATLANFTATIGQWYKCDITADGTTAYLYINGTKYIEAAIGTIDPYLEGDIVYIFGYDVEEVRGMMDEVAFFDYHRTEQDIVRQYAFEMGLLL
ncbi:MAG: hypothetical protein PHD57_13525 [Desulfobacterales bacterium]|nr:hypothetical protein [Desulfobacterales bacterium]